MGLVFVPSPYRSILASLPKGIIECASEPSVGFLYTLPVTGYLATIPDGFNPADFFGEKNCLESFTTKDGQSARIVLPLPPSTNIDLDSLITIETHSDSLFAKPMFKSAIDQMKHFLSAIVLGFNIPVTLHLSKHHAFEPYYPDDERRVHIVLNSRVPGDATWQSISVLDNLDLARGPRAMRCAGPTHGRGEMVMLDDEFCIGQIVGSTIYLFIPDNKTVIGLYSHEHDNPFRIALAKAWDQYLIYLVTEEAAPVEIESGDSFAKETLNFGELMLMTEKAAALATTERIERLKAELSDEYTHLRLATMTIEAITATTKTRDVEAEWRSIMTCPYIDSVTKESAHALHYHSKPVIMEDDTGNLHDVGSFTIRIKGASIAIWSTRITHPERIPHPHINADNIICFGNVTSEITKLCGEFRTIEAVLLCFRWLFEGYEPGLTLHKLEEWPIYQPDTTEGAH